MHQGEERAVCLAVARLVEGELRAGAQQVGPGDDGVVRVEHHLLEAALQQFLRMGHEVLIERVGHGDQHRERRTVLPADPADPLPRRHDAARIADQKTDIQAADVHPQLQCARGDHSVERPVEQASLDLPPFLRKVARAVGAHASRIAGRRLQQPRVQKLRDLACLGEGDGAIPFVERPGEELRGGGVRARPRVQKHQVAGGARRAAPIHDREAPPRERLTQSARIGNRGGRRDEARSTPIVPRHAQQSPQHVVQVRPEDPPVDMQFVHHDARQVLEKQGPVLVVRQDPEMQHVGIGDDDVGRLGLDLAAPRVGRITVIDRGRYRAPGPRQPLRARHDAAVARRGRREFGDPLELILGQGLVREQVERPRPGTRECRLQGRKEIDEALAAGRRSDGEDVLPGPDPVDRFRLVAVEPVDPQVVQGAIQRRGKGGRERGVRGVLPRDGGDERDVVAELFRTLDPLDEGEEDGVGLSFAHGHREARLRLHVGIPPAPYW